jgi:hypothetical protein
VVAESFQGMSVYRGIMAYHGRQCRVIT